MFHISKTLNGKKIKEYRCSLGLFQPPKLPEVSVHLTGVYLLQSRRLNLKSLWKDHPDLLFSGVHLQSGHCRGCQPGGSEFGFPPGLSSRKYFDKSFTSPF